MPFAVFKKVREVSSEDNVNVAQNLLNIQAGKKWKSKSTGEKAAYVILELSENQQICGIDLGNEHSAFIEVLVGTESCSADNFKEILLTCSFMTPIESKNSTNPNRVRCFNQEALVSDVARNKWSLVKVVCTQPFNKHVQYGLSFIKVHVVEENPAKTNATKNLIPKKISNQQISDSPHIQNSLRIGKFKLRQESSDSDSETASGLFKRWKELNGTKNTNEEIKVETNKTNLEPKVSEGAQTPRASLSTKPVKNVIMDKSIRDRNRDELLFGQNESKESKKRAELDHSALHNKQQKSKEDIKKEKISLNDSNQKSVVDNGKRRNCSSSSSPNKKSKLGQSTQSSNQTLKYKPFHELLKGVVLVISGIQNPDRTDLRNKALALGAKYKANWDNTCTHLICAFKNTPKYNEVKGKGRIVTRTWLEKCHEKKMYIPWRRYALDSADLTKDESDDEILADTLRPQEQSNAASSSTKTQHANGNNTLVYYDLEDENPCTSNSLHKNDNSDSDTEDEIDRVHQKNLSSRQTTVLTEDPDIYDVSTEEEDYLNSKLKELNQKQVNSIPSLL